MSSLEEKEPTYEEILAQLLQSATGQVSARELIERLLAARPSDAKNPKRAMRIHLRKANGKLLVFLDRDTVLPIRLAFQGVRFRLQLEQKMVDKGLVNIGDSLPSYLPQFFPLEQVRFVDIDGNPIASEAREVSRHVNTIIGRREIPTLYANMSAWLRAQEVYYKDHLLITILDWEQGVLQLEREPIRQVDQDLLAQRDRLLADVFFDVLEREVGEYILIRVAVPTAYARLPEKSSYPPNHWSVVVEEDERMTGDNFMISYSESHSSPLERLAREIADEQGGPARRRPARVSKEAGEQVYRFKAALTYRPDLWREIELQGKHSLAHLDFALRDAFEHDPSDHLGGFWRLIPRGARAKQEATKRGATKRRTTRGSRYREVELADVDPFGDGEGADTKIAQLEFSVGDRLKYVYDFGDWIEHSLTLEAIEAPQAKVEYPREVARNEPEYVYCVECQKKGRQTVAKWICLECSTGPDQNMLLCEKCIDEHEDHYAEEILY